MTATIRSEAAPAASPLERPMAQRPALGLPARHPQGVWLDRGVAGVDLDLFPGECLGLVGDNAAGKSTLTKILAGTYIADAGTIGIDGEPGAVLRPGRCAGPRASRWSIRTSACATRSTSPGICFLAARSPAAAFLDQATMRARGAQDAGRLGIRIPNLSANVEKLSGGQRQSIAIARAASFKPQVLIMDEPTSALAVAEVEAVLALINRVKASGVSVVLITHRLQDLFRVCDRIAVMYEGTKVAERRMRHQPGGSCPAHRRRGTCTDDGLHRSRRRARAG